MQTKHTYIIIYEHFSAACITITTDNYYRHLAIISAIYYIIHVYMYMHRVQDCVYNYIHYCFTGVNVLVVRLGQGNLH